VRDLNDSSLQSRRRGMKRYGQNQSAALHLDGAVGGRDPGPGTIEKSPSAPVSLNIAMEQMMS
jgi:hypothetical protein